jgi:Ca2+-binding EF-hand superfamily protein
MWRFLAGVGSTLLLVAAGFFVWKGQAEKEAPLVPPAPLALAQADTLQPVDVVEPPRANPKSKEEKRFNRYDKDKNGGISREEYLASRRKAFAKLDTNGDGKLSFDEYVVKTSTKFVAADRDRSGILTRAEFATTRVIRKEKPKPDCPPVMRPQPADDGEDA